MNLVHVQAVRARIAEIQRKISQCGSGTAECGAGSAGSRFQQVLNVSQSPKCEPCPADLEPMIADAAQKYGLDPSVIRAVISAESGFRPGAVSSAGARGLMQLMPGTARALGVDPTDPAQNIDGGARYLSQQIDRFGSLELGLAAYNAGPGSVARYGGVPPYSETRNYVTRVMSRIAQYSNDE